MDKLRVLVADEDWRTVQAISTMCRLSGHELHVTKSGAEVLPLALRIRPTLIVLALQLPDTDGRDVLRDLKKDARLAYERYLKLAPKAPNNGKLRDHIKKNLQ